MIKHFKRPLSVLLAVLMIAGLFTTLPMTANADGDPPTSGECGENVSWEFSGNLLYFQGNGDMEEGRYEYQDCDYSNDITEVYIDYGITSLSYKVCVGLESVERAHIGDDVRTIDEMAFSGCTSLRELYIGYSVESIDDYAFEKTAISSLYFSENIKEIGYRAFSSCENLTTVTFAPPYDAGQDLTIGEEAFPKNCLLDYESNTGYVLFTENDEEVAEGTDLSELCGQTLTWEPRSYDYYTENGDGYNFNDTIAVGAGDTLAEKNNYSVLYNFKTLGVQKKTSPQSIRFITVINSEILKDSKVEEYGYIIIKPTGVSTVAAADANIGKANITNCASAKVDCKGTDNNLAGDYGQYSTSTTYKYVTAMVNNVNPDTIIAARFYLKTSDGTYYTQYTNDSDVTYDGCAAKYSELS